MFDEQDRQYFYNEFKNNGYEVGSYDDFKKDLNNKEDRDWYYNEAKNMGYDVGTQADFDKMVLEPAPSASSGAQQVAASPQSNEKSVSTETKPQVAQPAAKPAAEKPKEDNRSWFTKWMTGSLPEEEKPETADKEPGLIAKALGMIPTGVQTSNGTYQPSPEIPQPVVKGEEMPVKEETSSSSSANAASPESKEVAPVTTPTGVVNNEGLMDAKLANYLENWKQRPDKEGDYFENMVADLLADGTANSNEEAVKMVKSALGRYANRSAMDVTNQVVSSLPDDTVQDAEQSIEAQWYSHGVQDKLKQEADNMGISYDDYVGLFLKPAMVQSLVNKYGPNYRNIAEGIATRLYAHDEHVQDRLMNQDINDALSSVIKKYVDSSVVDEYNNAQEAGSKAFTEGMAGSQFIPANLRLGTALGAQYEANEAKDPAKVLSSLQKKFGKLYRNPEFLNDMSNAAFKVMQRYGLNGTQSSDPKQFKPMINSVLKNELDKLEVKGMMPKGSAEYIMKTGLGNTIVGKIIRKAVQTDYQNWLEDIANQQYQPGFWENVASGALTFVGDAWSYWLPGAAGGKLTKSMLAKAEGRLAGDLMAKGMESRMATRAAKLLIGKSKTEALKSGAVHGAVTFGGQSAISKPIDEKYRTGQFDENGKIYNPSGWKIALDTLLEGGKQGALGVIMQGNTIANMIGKGRGLATNILADVGGKVADSGIMTGHQMLERMAQDPNFKPTGKDAAESFLESMANLTAIGLPGMVGKYARFKDAREFNKKYDFTDQDIAELKRFGYEDLRDAFEKVGIGEYAVEGENAQRLDGQLTQKYMNLMNDKSVPEVLKAKMMAVVEGKRPSSFSPVVDSVIVQPMDNGKVYLETLNKDGGIIDRKEYSSLDDAQKADKKLEYEKTLGLASVLEGKFHNEFTQEHLDGLYNQAAQKYNMGEKLTDEDKAAVYLHQNAGAIKDIMDKQQKGIILTEEEQKQVDTYRHFYNSALENSSVMREFVNTFEDSHGVARGTLRKALESKDKKYAPLVESYLKELYNSIELKREMKQTVDDLYNTAHGNEQKRIEQNGIEGEKPASSVEGSAVGQEPPVSAGPAPYQDRTNSVPTPSDANSAANVANSSAEVATSDAFVMGQEAYKNGDSDTLKAIDYNSDLATGRLKRAFADSDTMFDLVTKTYNEGRDMEQFVAQRAGNLTPAQKEAISKYVEAMDAKKGAIDALQHADDGYGEALKEQLWPYQTEDGNIVPATLTSGKQVFLKKANEYGGGFVVVPDEQGQPTIKQVSNAEIKEVGTPVSLDEYIEKAVAQQKDARNKQFLGQFNGAKKGDIVSVYPEGADSPKDLKIAGYTKDGKVVLTDVDVDVNSSIDPNKLVYASKEEFETWRKNALENTINERLDREDDEREQEAVSQAEADKQERYKKGIFGYAAGQPDYSDTQTAPKVAAEYLQETAGEDRKALFANIVAEKQALQKRINQLRDHIASNEEWLSINADLDPKNAETRTLANKQMEGQIADLQARFDNWNKIRSAVMTPEEAQAIKADRTQNIADAGVNEGDVAPIEGREVAVLSDEELKKQYPTMDEASDFIASERKRIYRIQSDEVQREIDGVDEVLDRFVNGEIDLEPEQIKELNTTKAQLQARQANLTESAKELKAQADKLKTLYRKENMEARAKAVEDMTPAEQRAIKVENAIKNGNMNQLNSIYEEVRGATDFNDTEPNTLEEYVANNIGRFTLNYEGKEKGGAFSNGIQQETGLGRKDFEKLQILAKEGEGKTVPEFVHGLDDDMPENLKQMGYTDHDIRSAFLDLIGSAQSYSDIKNYTLNNKVANVEQQMREVERQEEEMMQDGAHSEASFGERLKSAIAETETEPTEAQKKAGNYKKGHLTFGGYDFTVETPKGVTRSGKDEQGKPWSVTMHDTYGYILGKIGVDGDHIDMFINDAADLDTFDGNVYVVDQVNPETGEFDEHKVMYGYPSEEAATEAYLANYSKGWKGLGKVTSVPKATFDKWLESSDRKTKPFADYAMIQHAEVQKAKETDEALPFDAPMNMDDLPFHRDVKEVKPSEMTEAQKVAYDAVSTMLKKAGIPVKVVSNEDMEKVAEAQDNLNLAMLLNQPEMRFKIKTPEEKQAAENAYNFAKDLRPNKWAQYAVVDMSNPNKMPEYYQKQELARKERTYLNRLMWGNYKVFNLGKSFEDNVAGLTGSFPSEFDPYKIDAQTSKKNELKKQIKETEEAYKSTGQERKEYQNQLMKEYMDEHGLASENDIPDDVWREFDYKAIEKYQDKLDSLFAKYKDLDRQLKAVVQPGVRFLRTYHGSQASFDKFDHSFMGSGEGAQAYGWGTYVSEVEGIAKAYAKSNATIHSDNGYKEALYKYREADFNYHITETSYKNAVKNLKEKEQLAHPKIKNLEKELEEAKSSGDTISVGFLETALKNWNKVLQIARKEVSKYEDTILPNDKDVLEKAKKRMEELMPERNLYSVDIPDDTGRNYIGWDEPLGAAKIMRLPKVFKANGWEYKKSEMYGRRIDVYTKYSNGKELEGQITVEPSTTGGELYKQLASDLGVGSDKAASEFLSKAGFVGVKVIAQRNTGGNKKGMMNYVIFDENNAKIVDHTKFAQGKGVVYGYTDGKEIVLNQEHLNPNTPIHEYQHLWRTAAKEMNPELIAHGDELIKQTQLFADLKEDPNYKHLSDDEICDEAFARLTGEDGAAILEQMAKDAIKENPLDTAKELTIINRLKNWLKKFWYWTLDTFTKWKPEDIKKMTLEDIRNLVLRDLANGVDPRTKVSKSDITKENVELEEVNKTFNQRLDELVENPNQKDKILRLGRSSSFLKAGGIADAEIELDFDKLMRKSKQGYVHEHPFDATDVKDLPMAIANPISVFNNTNGRNDGQVILTELKKENRNFIVAIQTENQNRKGGVVLKVNKIVTLFPKDARGVINWFNQGKATNIDKEKALHFIEALQNHSGTTITDEELKSAANIINSFETTKEKGKKFSLEDPKTLAGVHNISEEKLLKAIKQGGLANPSVAVIDTSKQDHKAYGDISLILPSDKIAKRTGKNAGTWQGDAYTPTYPEVEKQMSNKGAEKSSSDVLSVPKEMQHEVRNGIDRWLNGGDANSGLKYLFLHEKGNAPKMVELQHKYSDKVYNDLKSITAGNFDISSIGKADAQKVLDMYIDSVFDGDRTAYDEKQKYRIARYKKQVAEGVKNPFLLVRAKNALEQYDKYGFYFDKVQEFVRKVESDHRMTGFDTNATLNDVEDYIKTNNLTDEFNTWLEGKEKEYGIKEVIFDGFTPSGNRRYVPNTLENVSKIMKKQGRNGATGAAVSFQNFAARLMPSYGTLKDIRSKKGLLTSDREKFDKFRDKWSNVFFELGNKCQPDSTSAFDSYGMERLSEAAMTSDPQAYLKKEYNVDFSDADTKRLKDMVKAIKEEHPAMYFETKFERPVRFDEFSAAVVPTTTKKEVKEALKNAGVSIFEYDEKSDADRKRAFNEAVSSKEGIRFMFAGEKGAAEADKAEEKTYRMDNLKVAEEMERGKKDAKAIKLATGWERGADGKWRYEMPDAKIKDMKDIGGGHIVKRYEDDMLWNGGKLSNVIDAPGLFEAYPQLKDVRIDTDAIMNDMPSNGEYNPKTNTITIHADELKYMNSILNHEIQHAIQFIEGFATGGNEDSVRSRIENRMQNIEDAANVAAGTLDEYRNISTRLVRLELARKWKKNPNSFLKSSAMFSAPGYGPFTPKKEAIEIGQQLADTWIDDAKRFVDSRSERLLAGEDKMDEAKVLAKWKNEWHNKYVDWKDFKEEFDQLDKAIKDLSDYQLYHALAGEVESRNVQNRLGMTDEERRNSLAEETEDVNRDEQIVMNVGDTSYSIVKDPETIKKLDKEDTVKVYRAMQVGEDGKLYPPMAAKVKGKFVEPIELGKWEQADERPELADDKGMFTLNKGNGKSLKAAYNPYLHTSRTPLNDQFSEAQNRPNIVTVEVEVPKSELTSGYKADKAKDAVGEVEWKAGIIQGQLTGKRKVVLSRWDKPVRIVPDSEVADVIVNDMFKGKNITMPSNVVTPSLRKELEKRGVPFVETDNRGRIVGGENDGVHYSKVYGKKANVKARLGSAIIGLNAENERKIADSVVNTANKLGGAEATVYSSLDDVPEEYRSEVEQGAKGWYDPETHTVHVYLPNCEDGNDAQRTVFHEKIGHEGMEVLLGGEDEVRKFANFVYNSVAASTRGKILEIANEYDPDWKKHDRMNVGTQEYIARLAEEGPKTAEDFSLWTKIKHYLIKVLKKLGIRVPGLLNDKDLRYYLMKAGKALHVWDEMPQEKQEAMMKQASNAEIKDSLGEGAGKGKPRQKKGESMIQYMKRVQEWRKWKNAREDENDPEPPMFYDIDKDEAGKKEWAQLNKDWRERHHLAGEEPTGLPIRMEGEEDGAYMTRIHEYEKWKDAMKDQEDPMPDMFAFEKKKQEEVKRKYEDWLARHELLEQQQADLDLYEGKIYPAETNPKADDLEQQVMQDLAEVTSTDVSKEGAARSVHDAVIYRRKNIESASADDAIFINSVKQELNKMANASYLGRKADAIADAVKETVTGKSPKTQAKKMAEAIPYIIEAPRRMRDIADEMNAVGAFENGHIHVTAKDIDAIQPFTDELRALASKSHKIEKDGKETIVYDDVPSMTEVASKMAKAINDNHVGEEGFVPVDGTDILAEHVLPVVLKRIVPEGIEYKNLSEEMQSLLDKIREWYDKTFTWLKDSHTVREDIGYTKDYVNHRWDKEKSDDKAYADLVEGRQRTKSPNEKPRKVSTYMEGVDAGLVPKTTDITDLLAYYSQSNIEAFANKTFLQELSGINVIERNKDGEITSSMPLLSSIQPKEMMVDENKYTPYVVPGINTVWVYNQGKIFNKSAEDWFNAAFGTVKLSKVLKGIKNAMSIAKTLELGFSGFHAGALTEVYAVQNSAEFGPAKAMAYFMKYLIADTAKNHQLPTFANPEVFKEAAKHLVKFGSTSDYATADIENLYDKVHSYVAKLHSKLVEGNVAMKAGSSVTFPLEVATELLRMSQKGLDVALWSYLHDGLKLATYQLRAERTRERAKKMDWDEDMLNKALDEDGQFVNDMFGGQHFDVLGISKKMQTILDFIFLSKDWLISTTRHALSIFGYGSIWNEASIKNFWEYYKHVLGRGEMTKEDYLRLSRSKSGLLCYGIGFMIGYEGLSQLVNAAMRAWDEEKQKEKADEIRKTNPSYKSPYELAYPDGMHWYDYLMRGNSLGQQSKIFMGRYADGTEMYIRHGKQFREIPELFFDAKDNFAIPGPMVRRMYGKASPLLRGMIDTYKWYLSPDYGDKEMQRKYGENLGLIPKLASYYIPFAVPTQKDKEFKMLDLVFPSSKGFSRYKAQDYFKTFIMSEDKQGLAMTYNACVQNGIDPEVQLKAAISSVKALEASEMSDGVTSLQEASKRFDAAKSITEKKKMRQKMKKFLSQSDYKAFTQKEALDMVQGYLNGDEDLKEMEKAESKYLMAAKAEDVTEDWRIQNVWNGTMEAYQEYQRLKDIDKAKANAFKNSKTNKRLFGARKAISAAKRKMNKAKKQMDGTNGAAKMVEIRKTRKELLNTLNGME